MLIACAIQSGSITDWTNPVGPRGKRERGHEKLVSPGAEGRRDALSIAPSAGVGHGVVRIGILTYGVFHVNMRTRRAQ